MTEPGAETMEPPSFTVRIPWLGLLLTAFFLTSWNLPVTAQLTVESVPPNVVEGGNVLLLVHTGIDNVKNYQWYKGPGAPASQLIATYQPEAHTNTTGPAYSHRETIYPNGSLLLEKVTEADIGFHTLQAIDAEFKNHLASVQFHVYPQLPKPSITSNNSSPVEGEDSVVLTCEPDFPNISYLWRASGQSLPDDDWLQLSNNNRTLTLLSVLRDDTGPYECRVWNPASEKSSDPFTLNILYGPDTPTILPPRSHFLPGTNLTLSCHAASNPPAQYSWLIDGRPQPSSPELLIPNITANNSGSYTCLTSNSATGLSRTAVKNITVVAEETHPGLHAGGTAGIVTGVIVGVALVAALGYILYRTKTGRASSHHDLKILKTPVSTGGQGTPNRSVLDPSTGHRAAVPIYEELLKPDTNIYGRIDSTANTAS